MDLQRESTIHEILYRLKKPVLFAEAINIISHRFARKLGIFSGGIDVFERDWDNLIILDACRYDYFKKEYLNRDSIDGNLEKVRSQATQTGKFLLENIHGKQLHDTVYVTTSPHLYYSKNGERKFEIDADLHKEIHVWQDSYHPEDTTEAAIKACQKYSNKRLIVHFLPPHTPFLEDDPFAEYDGVAYEEMKTGEADITHTELATAYKKNLQIGLDCVEQLLPKLSGKTVITSDHGQLLGDREFPIPIRGYGHPELYMDSLLEVPWLEISNGDRRKIIPDPPIQRDLDAEAAAKESLRDLGYL